MKRVITGILAGMMVLLTFSCGGDGPSVTLTQVSDYTGESQATITVGYSEGTTPTDNDDGEDEELINEEKDFSVELYLYYDADFDFYMTDAEGKEGYKKVKYSGFDGYMYKSDDYEYEIGLKIKDMGDEDVYLFAYVAPGSELIDTQTTDIEKIFNQKEVQDILNSVKYKGVKEVKGE